MNPEIQLTPEQEKKILDAFNADNSISVTDLTKLAFPENPDIDGRSKEGRAVKLLLAAQGLKARTTGTYKKMDRVPLSDSHKEFIGNNRNKMTPVDMARTIFANPQLSNLDIETRSVAEYVLSLEPLVDLADNNGVEASDVPLKDYASPRTAPGVLLKIDKYVFAHDIQKDNMTAAHRACLDALLAYMNTFRFIHQINLYESQTNRDLFESSFVRYCYDKADLTEEEVDQYIVLSHEAVNSSTIQTRIERLQILMDDVSQNSEKDKARISMSLVDAINTLQNEYNQSAKRFNDLLNSLKQKRSDRLMEQRSANASILNLVQLWKEEKSRKKFIHIADMKKQDRAKAVEELSTMEAIKARVFGISQQEIIDG